MQKFDAARRPTKATKQNLISGRARIFLICSGVNNATTFEPLAEYSSRRSPVSIDHEKVWSQRTPAMVAVGVKHPGHHSTRDANLALAVRPEHGGPDRWTDWGTKTQYSRPRLHFQYDDLDQPTQIPHQRSPFSCRNPPSCAGSGSPGRPQAPRRGHRTPHACRLYRPFI